MQQHHHHTRSRFNYNYDRIFQHDSDAGGHNDDHDNFGVLDLDHEPCTIDHRRDATVITASVTTPDIGNYPPGTAVHGTG